MAAILSFTTVLDSLASAALVSWLFRITLLTALACAYVALARRTHPALRHAVAVGSLLAVVLLPVASKLLPAVSIPMLPSRTVEAPARDAMIDPAPISFDVSPSTTITVGAIDAPAAAPVETVATPSLVERGWTLWRDAFLSPTHWTRFALVLWVLVAGALLARLALAFRRAGELSRASLPVDDDAINVAVERACRVLGLKHRPMVAISDTVSIPMVTGVLKPRIILPAAAMSWSHQRLGVVLLHEIGHIRRGDVPCMLFARVVNACLWFHPLVRVLSLHVRRDSELACDDLVLRAGVRGSDYAGHLVSIASMSARRDALAGATLAFAARSTLEQRVASILAVRRRVPGPRLIAALALASVASFVTIAAGNPTTMKDEYRAGKAEYERAKQEAQREAVETVQRLAEKQECRQSAPQPVEQMVQSPLFQQSIQQAYQAAEQTAQQFQYAYNDNGDDDASSDDGEEWYDRAHNYYQRERWEKAARAYENAARFGYNREVAYYNAGCSYALSNETDKAFEMLEAAIDEGFDDPDHYATDSDLNSLRADPRFKKLMETVMTSGEGDRRRRAATREYDRLSDRKDVDAGDWSSVGIDLMRAGDYDRAASAFDNAFKLSQNTSENAIYNKACARALGGKSDEALKLLEQAIAIGSVDAGHMEEDPDLLSLHKNKKFSDLVKLAEDLDLDYAGLNHNQVWSISGKKVRKISFDDEVKEWKKAVSHFTEMANRHPTYGRAWSNLGFAQLKAEQPKESTPSFQKALDLGYRAPVTMYNLACSTALSGQTDAAFAWLDKSEKAGFEVWNHARWDEDLDPLRADPRYKELKKRWKDKEREHDHDDDDHDQTIHINID